MWDPPLLVLVSGLEGAGVSHRQCPVEQCCRDAAVAAEEWRVSRWGQQERLFLFFDPSVEG